MAKTMTISFKRSFTDDDYTKLRECLDNERRLFSQVINKHLKNHFSLINAYYFIVYYILLLITYHLLTTITKQAFKDFENLPNLHVNYHLVQHARNYATLLNTAVGTKEMVHRIFKNIVPRTNRKNVDLDLLKRYTSLFAIRHLFDGGVDNRFPFTRNALTSLPNHLKRLMNDWFIVEKSSDLQDDDINNGLIKVC
jgi:hypothetical protein